MSRESNSLNFTNIKSQSSGRTRIGIAAVFGNIDAANDRIMPGAFTKTIAEGAKLRCNHLWAHSWEHPPIASIKELRELSRNELPPEVLAKAPEATGGLLVAREYYDDVPLSKWILKAIDAGDLREMSFAYDVLQSSYVTESKADSDQTHEVRELKELRLYDTSDVLLGCNSATVTSGAKILAKSGHFLSLGAIASQLIAMSEQIKGQLKAGSRNSTNDLKLIELMHTTTVELGAICKPDTNDDGKSGNPAEQHQADQQIDADEQIDAKAEADSNITSLSDLRLRAIRLQAANLRME